MLHISATSEGSLKLVLEIIYWEFLTRSLRTETALLMYYPLYNMYKYYRLCDSSFVIQIVVFFYFWAFMVICCLLFYILTRSPGLPGLPGKPPGKPGSPCVPLQPSAPGSPGDPSWPGWPYLNITLNQTLDCTTGTTHMITWITVYQKNLWNLFETEQTKCQIPCQRCKNARVTKKLEILKIILAIIF